MTAAESTPLVSTDWLAARLGSPSIGIVDASWYLPSQVRDARQEYRDRHIPGAVFFDIDAVSDRATALPHMLPTAPAFAEAVSALGLSNRQHIIIYDGAGLFSAARVWWTFRTFGATQVSVLDGGMPAWIAEGRPVENGEAAPRRATFDARLSAEAVSGAAEVAEALTGAAQVVDARSVGRFRGDEPEPRQGLRSGHMPGARNLPASDLIENGRLKQPAALRTALQTAGVDLDRPIVTSCGSGVTAAILALALARLDVPTPRLYDGSWAEWGADPARPVATGPA